MLFCFLLNLQHLKVVSRHAELVSAFFYRFRNKFGMTFPVFNVDYSYLKFLNFSYS